MKFYKKLNSRGFSHIEAVIAIVVIMGVAAIGVRVLSSSHADAPNTTSSTTTGWQLMGDIPTNNNFGNNPKLTIYACLGTNLVKAKGVFSSAPPNPYNYELLMSDNTSPKVANAKITQTAVSYDWVNNVAQTQFGIKGTSNYLNFALEYSSVGFNKHPTSTTGEYLFGYKGDSRLLLPNASTLQHC